MSRRVVKGTVLSRGIAVGKPHLLSVCHLDEVEKKRTTKCVEREILRYQKAISKSIIDVESLQKQLKAECAHAGVAVLETHKQMLKDPLITDVVEEEIRNSKNSGLTVLNALIEEYRERFRSLKDPIIAERFCDIQDVADRVRNHLRRRDRLCLNQFGEEVIIFAHEVTPTDVAEMRKSEVLGIVTQVGTVTSHAAIIAKAKGIPFLSNLSFTNEEIFVAKEVIVDATKGELIILPTKQERAKYLAQKEQLFAYKEALEHEEIASVTQDGKEIGLSLNVDSPFDLKEKTKQQCCGVGLFRTEFLLNSDGIEVDEEEQTIVYEDLLRAFENKPVVIRLFDFGGDKELPARLSKKEENPAMGCRAIRLLLQEKQMLKKQLRAIYRAASAGIPKILLPMITTLSEVDEVNAFIDEVIKELRKEGHKVRKRLPLGCMVEVPTIALLADLVARRVDFLSIGTNDLTQFVMGADRANSEVSHLYTSHHPSILRLIGYVASEANKRRLPFSICGEIAADPRFTPLLIGLGLSELSLHENAFASVRHLISQITKKEAQSLAKKALRLSEASEVEELCLDFYRTKCPEDQTY